MTHPLRVVPLLTGLALLGSASLASADGVLYTTQDSVTVRAEDPYFARPRVSVGLSQGFQFGGHHHHNAFDRHRTGVGVGVGVGFQRQPQVSLFDLEGEARSQARRAVTRIKSRLRNVSGVVVGATIDDAGSGRSGFYLHASARARVVFLTPEPLPATHPLAAVSTPIATGVALRLVVDGVRPTAIPVTANEVSRLYRDPKAEKSTVLGGLIRNAWRDARGGDAGKKSKGQISLEVIRQQQTLGRYELPSLDSALGRPGLLKRMFGKKNQEPELDDELSSALSLALLRAETLEQTGRPRARQLLERLRAGSLAGIGSRERAVILKITGR